MVIVSAFTIVVGLVLAAQESIHAEIAKGRLALGVQGLRAARVRMRSERLATRLELVGNGDLGGHGCFPFRLRPTQRPHRSVAAGAAWRRRGRLFRVGGLTLSGSGRRAGCRPIWRQREAADRNPASVEHADEGRPRPRTRYKRGETDSTAAPSICHRAVLSLPTPEAARAPIQSNSSDMLQYHGEVEVRGTSQWWRAQPRRPRAVAFSWSPESRSEPFGDEDEVEDVPMPAVGI
jgi:hypothetical protein